jgi:hypothetical protein
MILAEQVGHLGSNFGWTRERLPVTPGNKRRKEERQDNAVLYHASQKRIANITFSL